MQTYLSAIRHLHISYGFKDPLDGILQLSLLVKGARREKPVQRDHQLPITPLILERIYAVLNHEPDEYGHKLLIWAACCLGCFLPFFAQVKPGERYDPSWHLSINDIPWMTTATDLSCKSTLSFKDRPMAERNSSLCRGDCIKYLSSESSFILYCGERTSRGTIVHQPGWYSTISASANS